MKKSNKGISHSIVSPMAAAVVSVAVKSGQDVEQGEIIATIESMKMQTAIETPVAGTVVDLNVTVGETIQSNHEICRVEESIGSNSAVKKTQSKAVDTRNPLDTLNQELQSSLDSGRTKAVSKRHAKGYRTARENLHQLCDDGSFIEYGQLAVAAQRDRMTAEKLNLIPQQMALLRV